MNTLEGIERKNEVRKRRLDELREEGNLTPAAVNSVIADTETVWELDHFDPENFGPFDEEKRDGFIIRARRDALEAKLNSVAALEGIQRIETLIRRLSVFTGIIGAIVAVEFIRRFI